ncbi:DcaP family trimeric outer membrane transporter [Telmatospirillum siberiense]|uniref:Uncharacterized protein n=1 Tax=Telmatospirillum siberiense TaxID=382514 RepID=A0A2N3PY10_9PROT|nr:DcaP family trimeric outer membrane transporter [Telmatospirillum siberiense]PKU25279.1 hypothetical protein CWS72_06675 [Telmatospirillum siberiense]
MRSLNKYGTMAAAVALLAASGTVAQAADVDLQSLQQQINQLQQQLKDLQAKQAAAPAPAAAAAIPVAAPPPAGTQQPGSFLGAFKIPGTNTMMKIGGFAKMDVTYDAEGNLGAAGAQSYAINKTALANATGNGSSATGGNAGFALAGTPAARQTGRFQMDARTSRLIAETRTPTEYGEVKFFIESEFRGSNYDGNSSNSNSSTLRLRQAYGTLGNLTAGQTYSLWTDRATIPNSIDLTGPAGTESGVRQAVLQYRWDLDKDQKNQIYVGVENPYNDYVGADKEAFTTAGGNMPIDNTTKAPDILAKYAINGSWGRWSTTLMARYLEVDDVAGLSYPNGISGTKNVYAHDATIGYGFSTGPKIYTGLGNAKNAILFRVSGGEGVGRYMNIQSASAVVNGQGKLQTQLVGGYNVNYQHWFTDSIQGNLIYGQQHTWNKNACAVTGSNSLSASQVAAGCSQVANGLQNTVSELEANAFWTVNPYVTFGAAYIYAYTNVGSPLYLGTTTGATRTYSGTTAHDNRIQFSTIIGF